MTETQPVCERCGAPARFHITGEQTGVATVRHLCIDCVIADSGDSSDKPKDVLGRVAVLVSIGLLVLGLSLFADFLKLGRVEGFGTYQTIAVVATGILAATGLSMRVPLMAVTGLLMGIIVVLADWIHLGAVPGFGYNQAMGVLLGLLLILAGFLLFHRHRRDRLAMPTSPEAPGTASTS